MSGSILRIYWLSLCPQLLRRLMSPISGVAGGFISWNDRGGGGQWFYKESRKIVKGLDKKDHPGFMPC